MTRVVNTIVWNICGIPLNNIGALKYTNNAHLKELFISDITTQGNKAQKEPVARPYLLIYLFNGLRNRVVIIIIGTFYKCCHDIYLKLFFLFLLHHYYAYGDNHQCDSGVFDIYN